MGPAGGWLLWLNPSRPARSNEELLVISASEGKRARPDEPGGGAGFLDMPLGALDHPQRHELLAWQGCTLCKID